MDKWTRLVSMVKAKLAVQYLFDQATDAMASAASKTTELREVIYQYEELREIRNELKEQVNRMNMNHEDEIVVWIETMRKEFCSFYDSFQVRRCRRLRMFL